MNQTWVGALRAEFPATARAAFFDAAYENCGSLFARRAAERFFEDKADIGPGLVKAGGAGKGAAIEVIARTRAMLSDFLNAGGVDRVAFTPNTTQGVGQVLEGFDFSPGDNIVVAAMEHVAVLMPCLHLKRRGVEVRVVETENPLILREEDLLGAADARTRFIVCSYVQSASGCKLDMKALTDAAHARGIYVVTDAIQALGFERVDARALGVDALSGSPYKGMLGIEGMGFLYVAPKLCERLTPAFAGDNPAMTVDRERWELAFKPDRGPSDARKFEAGTIPFLSIYCLNAALERIAQIGPENIEAHVRACWDRAYAIVTDLDYEVVTDPDPARHSHSLLVRVGDAKAFVDFAIGRGVFLSAGRDGCVRVSVAPFTTGADLDALGRAFRDYKYLPER